MALQINLANDDTENPLKENMSACYAVINSVSIGVLDDTVYIEVWLYTSAASKQRTGAEPLRKYTEIATLTSLDLYNLDDQLATPLDSIMAKAYTYLQTLSRFSAAIDV